ncbi:DUF4344 domain-containing metallopeptidase [Yoonia sp. R2331]|uniref:DUF4344 domain-containing metallopeptidase n=1 Tax=Yoonia sp. R2331 TaxID=3237238 RepID=UPI0034E401D6
MRRLLTTATLIAATSASAQDLTEDQATYVAANLLGIFYHELGHALIDQMGLPIFGQEEDAADVLSAFMIDALFDEETAVELVYDTAFGFRAEADDTGNDVAWWDVHGPDLQRYYNAVCIFYGANPDERGDVAEDLGLPEERADYCPDEYDQAAGSWGAVLDELAEAGAGETLILVVDDPGLAGAGILIDVIGAELAALNAEMSLPQDMPVNIAACGEANAFYDPQTQAITMCTEFVAHLASQVD